MADERTNIEEQINTHQKRLSILLLQKATMGNDTPPHIRMEIADIEQTIQKLKEQLALLEAAALSPASAGSSPADATLAELDEDRSGPFYIPFVNRSEELSDALRSYNLPFLLIHAPVGYGKTRLLGQLRREYQNTGGWLWIQIDLRDKAVSESKATLVDTLGQQMPAYVPPSAGASLDRYIDQFTSALFKLVANDKYQKGIIVVFDSVEVLEDAMVTWLLNDFVFEVHDRLTETGWNRQYQYRAIFAGGYVGRKWELSSRNLLRKLPLDPFTLETISDAVSKVLKQESDAVSKVLKQDEETSPLLREMSNKLSRRLMRYTGGHPGCVAIVLHDLRENLPNWKYLVRPEKEQDIYERIVHPVIREIKQGIPTPLQNLFEMLSVFRFFNIDQLEYLRTYVPDVFGSEDIDQVLTDIESTRLVEWRHGFYRDDIVRRLFAIELRQKDPERFRELCRRGEHYYQLALQREDAKHPHLVAIEVVYQQLQWANVKQPPAPEPPLEQIIQHLRNYLDQETHSSRRRERANELGEALTKDWEFAYLVTEVYGEHAFTEIMQQLNLS